jgi:outer membrane lipoprotein-sorting protein
MKKIVFLLTLLALYAAGNAAAQTGADAAAIVRESRNIINADTVSTRSRMVITAKDGKTSERLIDQFSKKDAQGLARTVIVFQQPASVRNTRFLTVEKSGDDDRWIFLPSLGKIRRIASSEGGGSFMGTDFSYDDMALQTRGTDADSHRIIGEESLNGRDCYIIESVPGDGGFGYAKYVQWIDRDTKIPWKVELYDRRGTVVKLMEILEVKDVQGRLTPSITKMSTLAEGSSTTITMDIIKYDDPIPEGVFTTTYLETGRAR